MGCQEGGLGLVKVDAAASSQALMDSYILQTPVQVDLDGFVFLDGTPARKGTIHFAEAIGVDAGRGVSGPGKLRQVRGLWEIHPVLGVKVVPCGCVGDSHAARLERSLRRSDGSHWRRRCALHPPFRSHGRTRATSFP